MYEFDKIIDIIKDIKDGVTTIEDGYYQASKKLGTYHHKMMDKYSKKGLSRTDGFIILVGRCVGSSYTDPFTMYLCRHAIWSEPEIERMEDVE